MTSEPPTSAVGLVLHPTKPVDRSIETIIASIRGMPVRLLAREIDRHRLPAEVSVVPDAWFVAGFSDVVLGRSGRTGAVSLDLAVNNLHYGYYRADAVIVSTPTGSTAYNYAAGGPVLSPSSGAVVITPVAPLSGISRPVVLGAEDRVCFTTAEDSTPVAIDVDGISAGELGRGDRLTATVRPEAAQVVRLSAGDYAKRSRVKLSLLDLPLRPDQLLELIPPELRRNV